MTKANVYLRAPKYLVEVIPEEWSTHFAVNPRQRDIERHAKKLIRNKTLGSVLPQHFVVEAALLAGGRMVKLNGHTRGYMWDNNLLPAPEKLSALIFPCHTMDDAILMYAAYDSKAAVEDSADLVLGAFRQHEIEALSPFLKTGKITQVTKVLYYARTGVTPSNVNWDIEPEVGIWRDEIILLDTFLRERKLGKKKLVHSGIITGMLLTFHKYGWEDCVEFWTRFMDGEGHSSDPHMKLLHSLYNFKSKSGTAGFDTTRSLAGQAVTAHSHYVAGNTLEGQLRSYPIHDYFAKPMKIGADYKRRQELRGIIPVQKSNGIGLAL